MKNLPITAFCSCKNGEPWLKHALKSVDCCEQKILLNDNSTDNSVQIAKDLGWEIWEWTGPNDMSERRNYGIGYKGDGDYTPWWVTNNQPLVKIRHDYLLQVDHDEVFGDKTDEALEAFCESEKTGKKGQLLNAFGFYLTNVLTEGDRKGECMTATPIPRLFRVGHVHWREAIQNDTIFDGDVGWIGSTITHYGYGSWMYHWEKQWDRLPLNESRVLANPNDLMSRGYLINCLTVIGETDVLNFDRIVAQVTLSVETFKKEHKNQGSQMIMERIMRHFFSVCSNLGKQDVFLWVLDKVGKNIDWIVDVAYWKLQCALTRQPVDCIEGDKECRKYLSRMRKHKEPPIMSVEIMSADKEVDMCKRLYELLLYGTMANAGNPDRGKYAKMCAYWQKKVVIHSFIQEIERRGVSQYLLEREFGHELEDMACRFCFGTDEDVDQVLFEIKEGMAK